MKLLLVINVDWFFLSHRLPIAKAAVAAGWDVHIATSITTSADALRSHGFEVHCLKMHRTAAGPAGLVRLAFDLVQLFRSVQPDVVHLVTIKPVLIGGLAARFARVPAVVYAISGLGHVFTAGDRLSAFRRFLVRALYRVALGAKRRRLIFQNEFDLSEVSKIARVPTHESVLILGSGFDVDSYDVAALPPGRTVFLMASRLIHTKGVGEFCKAAQTLGRERADADFWLAGPLDESNPAGLSAQELEQIRKEGWVKVLGFHGDIPDLMSRAHVVVLPSYYGEGLPKVLIEAAACGRAVITTDMPGCRDAVEAGSTGLIVPPRDASALADAMRLLAQNNHQCSEMGRAARRRAEEQFRIQDVTATHLDIYAGLMREASLSLYESTAGDESTSSVGGA